MFETFFCFSMLKLFCNDKKENTYASLFLLKEIMNEFGQNTCSGGSKSLPEVGWRVSIKGKEQRCNLSSSLAIKGRRA